MGRRLSSSGPDIGPALPLHRGRSRSPPSGAASQLDPSPVRREGVVFLPVQVRPGSCRYAPVATEAVRRVTDSPKLSGQGPTLGGSASRRAAMRMKPEQASKENREGRPAMRTGKAVGSRRSNRPMKGRSLTGVGGVARRHRAWRQAGGPVRREVAALTSVQRRTPRWESEGSTVPIGPTRQHNWWGGRGPWFGVCFDGSRGGRLA